MLSLLRVHAQASGSVVPEVRRDVGWLAAASSRVVGTAGHDEVLSKLESEIRTFPGVTVWTHTFHAVLPSAREATLTMAGEGSTDRHRVYPLWPAGVRLNTTPPGGISGGLIYVRNGDLGDLPVKSLQGRIAVMDVSGGRNWRTLFALGVRAAILLGSEGETFRDFESHLLPIPVNFPRFYVPAGPLADKLRSGTSGNTLGTIRCLAEWREARATNIYALLKPAGTAEPRRALAIAAPIDAVSAVPDLAPGADAAVDAATALAALRRMAQRPPEHPVLFAFLDAYAIDQLGMRRMLLALGSLPELSVKLQKPDVETQAIYLEHEELARKLEEEDDPLNAFHRRAYRPLRDYVKQEIQKEVLVLDANLEPLRLRQFRLEAKGSALERDSLDAEIEALQKERFRYYSAQKQLIRATPVEKAVRPRAHALWQRARARIRGQLEAVERILAADAANERIRKELLAALGLDDDPERPVRPLAFLVGLDLSDASVAVGPSFRDDYFKRHETRNSRDFCRWLQVMIKDRTREVWPNDLRRAVNLAPTRGLEPGRLEDEGKEPDQESPLAVNLSPLKGLEDPSSHRVSMSVNLTGPALSFGLPAMTWATLDGLRARVDTPQDRPDRLDWTRLGPQVDATVALLDAWVRDPAFKPTPKVSLPHVLRIHGHVVDQAPGEPVARVPMEGYLTVLIPGESTRVEDVPPTPGMRRLEFRRTSVDGRFVMDGITGNTGKRFLGLQAYKLDQAGRIIRTVNTEKGGKGVRLEVDRHWRKAQPLRAVVFSCREFSVADLFDPRFLMPLHEVSVLDARRGVPRRLNQLLMQGMLSFCVEHGVRWELLLRAGIVGNRMVLVNTLLPEQAQGLTVRESLRGFSDRERLPAHPFLVAANDFYNLDARRLEDYRKAGLANKAIQRIQDVTRSEIEKADAAFHRDDGAGFFRHAMGALANEVRSYQAVRRTADDVIRGAIFLLLVLLPFSYAMERLLFASAHIYRQIFGGVGIFAVMATILWSFHPAFRMSSMPAMIIMAFGVIFMSLLVICMIFSKFEAELEKVRSGKAESSSAKTSRLGLLTTSIRLGIANMRKRKLRTALTGITVILITFALLCFMSASTYVEKTEQSVDARAVAPAVLVRQPGERVLPYEALGFLRNMLGADTPVIPRYWWWNSLYAQWRLHVRNPETGKQIALAAALGLSPEEPRVSGIDKVCPNWERFAEGNGCYLAKSAADELEVMPGDTVVIAGRSLRLTGVYDDVRFNADIRRIDGKSLLPPDYSLLDYRERSRKRRSDIKTLMLELAGGAGRGEQTGTPPLSSSQVALLPGEMLVGMKNCSLRSIAIPAGTKEQARSLAMDLSTKLAFPVYFGSEEEVRVVAATPLVPKAPKSLLIPLLIAGFIIFNTMLSSLAERKGEIYVYTSLGLAPLHIGVLFLAEAVTYGMLGSICGYVMGQGSATVFSALGWMGGITLNFGGTQAIATMLLVLAVVIVSSLVPAYLAGKVAAPSNEMRWVVPAPIQEAQEYVIRDILPFTATSKTAPGVAAFLHEYFEAHTDGAIGQFTSADLRATRSLDGNSSCIRIEGTTWLAPYDLGVRQHLSVKIKELPGDEDLYEIGVALTHSAGQIRTWHRLNRTFLGDLRRQLLGWRKLTSVRVLDYIAKGNGELLA